CGTSTVIEIIMDEGGGQSGTVWDYTAQVFPNLPGSLIKLGQRRLNLQGDGSYSGPTDIKEGVLRAQHDTALGQSISSCGSTTTTTTVEAGAALELAAGIPENNGGIRAGIQTWNEHLILNGAGNTFFGDAPLVNMVGTDLAGNDLVGDNMWRGPVTLNTFAT